jgi:hypothetical protein
MSMMIMMIHFYIIGSFKNDMLLFELSINQAFTGPMWTQRNPPNTSLMQAYILQGQVLFAFFESYMLIDREMAEEHDLLIMNFPQRTHKLGIMWESS